jgi:hypothetical protein
MNMKVIKAFSLYFVCVLPMFTIVPPQVKYLTTLR